MRANWIAGLLALSGCAGFTRPEGTGGWTAVEREAVISQAAASAKVDLEPDGVAPVKDAPLTLADALTLATRGNRPTAIAGLRAEQAAAGVGDARGRLLPNVTGNGRYTWFTDPGSNTFIPPIPGAGPATIIIRDQQFGTLGGTALVPLDIWGELRHGLAAAQAGYRGERARLWSTTLEQQLAVVRAYFQVLTAKQLLAVTDETITYRRRQVADAEARVAAGRLTRNELLVVQVALEDAEQRRVTQALGADRARWSLNDAIGLPVDAPTRVVDVTRAPDLPSPESALRTAYRTNPALTALLEERQRQTETATALERGRLPRFQGGGSVDWTSSDVLEPQRLGAAFVGFSWDLGLDGRLASQIAQAKIAVEQNRVALEQELRTIEAAVRNTQRAATERLSAVATATTAVTQAEENLRIREQQFDAGRATTEDVLAAQTLLAGQRAIQATARYDAHIYRAELQRLMGLPFDESSSR